jgi:hypothetical protein
LSLYDFCSFVRISGSYIDLSILLKSNQ